MLRRVTRSQTGVMLKPPEGLAYKGRCGDYCILVLCNVYFIIFCIGLLVLHPVLNALCMLCYGVLAIIITLLHVIDNKL